MEILIATNNSFKQLEQAWYLKGLNPKIHYPNEIAETIEVEEDGQTLRDNAIKKAVEISKLTTWLTFATDAGIDIPNLDGWDYRQPKRNLAAGTETASNQKLIDMMTHLQGEQRIAHYILAVAIASNGQLLYSDEFPCYSGYISEELPRDPEIADILMGGVWYLPQFGLIETELTIGQRNQLRREQQPYRQKLQQFLQSLI